MKEISYVDYQENLGDRDTAERLLNLFRGYRNRHNTYVGELEDLKKIIGDDEYVSEAIRSARQRTR